MIKTELLLTVVLTIIVAGSLSVASFESNAQNFVRDGVIKFSSSTIVISSLTSSTVVLSSLTSSTPVYLDYCSEFDCMQILMMPTSVEVAMGGVTSIQEPINDNLPIILQKNTSTHNISNLEVIIDSNESRHYVIELFENFQ